MKFAIRDDDLNYFYTPIFIEKNLNEVINICPVSMAVIPLVKGNWKINTDLIEKAGPGNITEDMEQAIRNDCTVFDISLNNELVSYVREKVAKNEICLAIHGIHHRNGDDIAPHMSNNFSIGAEFETKLNLGTSLKDAIKLVETCFNQKIMVFTPPQNSYSLEGALSVFENNISMCAYLPGVRHWRKFVHLFGMGNYLNYLKHRIACNKLGFYYPFPSVMTSKHGAIMDHCALQPSTDATLLMEKFRRVRDEGGNFVLSTHSYGFDFKMHNGNETMKKCLLRILDEVSIHNDVKFVTLNKIFEE